MRLDTPRLAGLVTLAALLIQTGCSQRPSIYEMDPGGAYRHLESRYEEGKYLEATEGLDYFTLNYSGSALVDSAQLLLGKAHYELKEYLIAASTFEELVRRFPSSLLVPEAMFMEGVCYWKLSPRYWLDQEYTDKCIDAFQAFIDYYPEVVERVKQAQEYIEECREKLAHKTYANGVIYLKMKDFRAASIYFRKVIDQYYDTVWAPRAAYQLARSLAAQGMVGEAAEAFRSYIAKYPDHPWQSRARSALSELEEGSGS